MKTTIGALLALALLTFSANAVERNFNPNRLLVKLKVGQQMPQSDHIKRSKKLFGDLYVVHTKNLAALEFDLIGNDAISYIERDESSKRDLGKVVPLPEVNLSKEVEATPFNDPKVSRQWTFRDASSSGISVTAAYTNRRSSPKEQVIVAVVDTGVDYNHEDLKDVMWVNEGEIAGNGIDDDGNGYIDDIHGINTLVRDANGNATVDMRDTHSHGTHVSGTIGATQNNNIGVAGVASNVRIMGIRTVPNRSDELDVDVIEAFLYAARNGAKVINCSFGKAHNEGGMAVSETIQHIGDKYGVLVVAAAGNSSQNIDSRLTYPASFENDNLFVIASTTSRGRMSGFSNYGLKNVDVASPGSGIYSTTPGNRYSNMSGTSMASPNVAGLAAEVLAHNPELTPVELKQVIMDSVTKVGSFSRRILTGGRVDLNAALTKARQE
jgi:thermitase